jgi:hypothetical protein
MKNYIKFKRHFMLVLVVASPLLLGGAKFWQDPAAIPPGQNCDTGVCCAKCIETADSGLSMERLAGWQWKLKVASRFMR